MPRILFVTGTDTGVGKTVVTALLAAHAKNVAALKPFCSGDRRDAELLAALNSPGSADASLPPSPDDTNPWYFSDAVSSWTAARKAGVKVTLDQVVAFIRRRKDDLVLVEGAGGILSPLGEKFSAVEIIEQLRCDVVLVAANKLGVLNQVRMALAGLGGRSEKVKVAFVEHGCGDESVATNLEDLREWVSPVPVIRIPRLERFHLEIQYVREAARKLKPELEDLLG